MAVEIKEYPAHDAVVLTPTEELLTAEVVHDAEALANSHLVK